MADENMEYKKLLTASENLENSDSLNINNQSDKIDGPDLKMIEARVQELEKENETIIQLQNEIEKMTQNAPGLLALSIEEEMEIDARSIFIGNVDYGTTAEELEAHFSVFGSINRVTILCDKYSGHPKGFAYIEFADKDSVSASTTLDESLFRNRQIKVAPKRTNHPGISSTNRPPLGRFHSPNRFYFSGYRPVRSFRRRSWYHPY